MKVNLISVAIVLIVFNFVSAANYCGLCQNHIACGNNRKFSSSCPRDARIVSLSNDNIQTVLRMHNDYRNMLAGGRVPGFKAARKMAVLKWDSELASLAELNVKKCKMEHDGCRATARYRSAGQNLYWTATTGNFENVNGILRSATIKWFNEYKYATQNDVNKCCGGTKLSKIGHFLQIVQDRAEAIGCAVSRYTKGNKKSTLVACNYSFGNLSKSSVYASGAAASSCSKGKSFSYRNLCN